MKRVFIVAVSILSFTLGALPLSSSFASDTPDPSVHGSVTNAEGRGVADAKVEVLSGDAVVSTAQTGATGAYALDIPDGVYSIRVRPVDSTLALVRSLPLELPRHWPLDFVLTSRTPGRISVTGDVSWSIGMPATSGSVLFAGAGTGIQSTGFFSSATLPGTTGTWSVNARGATGEGSNLAFFASGGPQVTAQQDLFADVVVSLTSTRVAVRDAHGLPIPNATVRINSGGYGLGDSRVALLNSPIPFRSNWTATARANSDGIVQVPRPELLESSLVTLMVDPPSSDFIPRSLVVTLPSEGGDFTETLSRRVETPAPVATVVASPAVASPTPSSSPSASSVANPSTTPSQTPVPTLGPVTYQGTIALSDGTALPGAIMIPHDPASRVSAGNSANLRGEYSVTMQAGFTGSWRISCRPQASLAVPDPLCFSLTGGDVTEWTQSQRRDFSLPMNLYRIRVVEESGTPIAGVRVSVAVDDSNTSNKASVRIFNGEAEFAGTWRGLDVTGLDGWAQIPGLTMTNNPLLRVSIASDDSSPYEGRMVTLSASELSDTVVALALEAPLVQSFSPVSAAPGEIVTVLGANFLGTQSVTIGGVLADFQVISNTRLSIELPENARSGVIQVSTRGGSYQSLGTLKVLEPPLAIDIAALPDGMVGSVYSAALAASGGLAPYTWRVRGSRPSGISVLSRGEIQGTPTRTVRQSVILEVTDASGKRVSKAFTIYIAPKPLTAPGSVGATSGRGSDRRISLSWVPPLDDGGNRILGYQVEASTDGGVTWSDVIANTRSRSAGTSFPYPAGVPTQFRVAAINALGAGLFGDPSPNLSAYGPSNPVTITDVYAETGNIRIRWNSPEFDGGTPVTGYRIRISTNGRSWSTVISNTRSALTEARFRVSTGRSYWVQVAALNAAGIGNYSTTASPTLVSR